MDTNMMELSMDELEMANGGISDKQVSIAATCVTIGAVYGGGAGLLTAGPIGGVIGAAAGAAIGGIGYGIYYLVAGD